MDSEYVGFCQPSGPRSFSVAPLRLHETPYAEHTCSSLRLLYQSYFNHVIACSLAIKAPQHLYLLEGRFAWCPWMHHSPIIFCDQTWTTNTLRAQTSSFRTEMFHWPIFENAWCAAKAVQLKTQYTRPARKGVWATSSAALWCMKRSAEWAVFLGN